MEICGNDKMFAISQQELEIGGLQYTQINKQVLPNLWKQLKN